MLIVKWREIARCEARSFPKFVALAIFMETSRQYILEKENFGIESVSSHLILYFVFYIIISPLIYRYKNLIYNESE